MGALAHELPDHLGRVRLRDGVPQYGRALLLLARPPANRSRGSWPDAPRWRSPHIASLTQPAIAAFIIALFAIVVGTGDPTSQAYLQLYGLMAVMGVIVILAIQALVSLAILVHFWRGGEYHWVKTVVCPIVAFVAQGVVLYLLFRNIEFLGPGYGYAKILGPIDAGVFVIGLLTALWLKRRDRAKYDTIGRLVYEGV